MTAHEKFDSWFTVVLLHHQTRQPGTVRHLPNGCGWVTDRSSPSAPIVSEVALDQWLLPLCSDCTDTLIKVFRDRGV